NDFSSDRRDAETFHLLHLIATGKTDAANRQILEREQGLSDCRFKLSVPVIDAMQKQGFGEQMQAFLAQLLEKKRDVPVWDVFITL
ncbi:UNVERIFIED_CONTAM: hypothetical protein IGO34_32420, partial [Salmonella enterica subsp. enterica serovar Weltevreden]